MPSSKLQCANTRLLTATAVRCKTMYLVQNRVCLNNSCQLLLQAQQ